MTPCKSCGAPVVWAVFEATGKRSPFDEEPTARGTWTLWRRDSVVIAKKLDADGVAQGLKRYTNHFATCPDAAKHRRAR